VTLRIIDYGLEGPLEIALGTRKTKHFIKSAASQHQTVTR